MDNLSGKVAVVTGGTRGIGRAIASRLIDVGAMVAVCCRHEPHVLETVEALSQRGGGTAGGMQCDITRFAEVHALFEYVADKFGGTDILINNAGLPQRGTLLEMAPFPGEWDYLLATNLHGAVYCCHEAIPQMVARGGGWIVNVSSLSAEESTAGNAGYVTSKAAMNAFAGSLMNEVRAQGIRVGVVMPGTVNTAFGGEYPPHGEQLLQPDDIAAAVVAMVTAPERALPNLLEIRPAQKSH